MVVAAPALQVPIIEDGASVGPPADTATAVRPVPRLTGVEEGEVLDVVVPSPNCPWSFRPQHFKSPLSRMAQVCHHPAETATAVRPGPRSINPKSGDVSVEQYHHRPTVRMCHIPNTSGHHCHQWHIQCPHPDKTCCSCKWFQMEQWLQMEEQAFTV